MGANNTGKIIIIQILLTYELITSLHEMKLKKKHMHTAFIYNNVLNVMGYVSSRASLPRKVQ